MRSLNCFSLCGGDDCQKRPRDDENAAVLFLLD
jgi:hypothetical protein